MASKKRAKRKVDHGPTWRVLSLGALVLSLAAGFVASPLTAPTKVRVTGAAKHQQAEIRKQLQSIELKPSLMIDAGALEAAVLRAPGIKSAAFRSNVFGRARLAIHNREPVALVDEKTAVDEAGRPFPIGSRKSPNLQISANVKDFNTIISISDASPLNRLCRVAKKIKKSLPKVVGTLEIDDRERIRLHIEDLVVEFGDTSDLDAKVDILVRALKENPQRAQQGGSINLVDPEDPVQIR